MNLQYLFEEEEQNGMVYMVFRKVKEVGGIDSVGFVIFFGKENQIYGMNEVKFVNIIQCFCLVNGISVFGSNVWYWQ